MQNIHVPLPAIVAFILDMLVTIGIAIIISHPSLYLAQIVGAPVTAKTVLAFSASIILAAFTMGLYQREFWGRSKLPPRLALALFFSIVMAICLSIVAQKPERFWTIALFINIPAFALIFFNRLLCGLIAERMKTSTIYVGPEQGLITLQKIERSLHPRTFAITGAFSSPSAIDRAQLDKVCSKASQFGTREIVVMNSCEDNDKFTASILSAGSPNLRVTLLSAFVERETRKLDIYDAEATHQLTYYKERRTPLSMVLKRTLDIIVALALLIFTLPLTLLVSSLILFFEGAPLFYHQERVGLGGRVFTLYKFRSMKVNAEADGVARWASKSDSRITPIGQFLRVSRIDEIPQLYNVLKGDMTLVGPRPERPSIVASLEKQIPLYAVRHTVTPGITGWAQINYPYGASVEDAVVKTCYDLYYVKNSSLLLDAAIILQTVRVILLGEGSR